MILAGQPPSPLVVAGGTAGMAAVPGRVMPSASAMACIVFAVPMPAQTPGVVTATSHMASMSRTVTRPSASSPTLSKTSSMSTGFVPMRPQPW